MKYDKPALSIDDQLSKLTKRGLGIPEPSVARRFLSNISYYRLRAYTYPYQDNNKPDQPFVLATSIDDIMKLYTFDRRLRLLILDAVERIEIALRTQIIYQWAMTNGSHWHLEQPLYKNNSNFIKHLSSLQKELKRCNETFIDHYNKKYTDPSEPPAWMSLEVTSIGLLSLLFQNLKSCLEKKAVTHHFGLLSNDILENWIHNFCNVRNICAHHGRLWNRRISIHLNIPKNTALPFIINKNIIPYKLYATLSAMLYCMKIINPESTFQKQLISLLQVCPNGQLKEMGFPKDWEKEAFWSI